AGGHYVAHLVRARREGAGKYVVDVGRHHQPVDRQAHLPGNIAGEDVAEIAGGNREGDLAVRRAERRRGGEIIHRLRHDPRPVDRIDARQADAVAEGVVIEHRLHQRLTVVEGAFDGDGVDVGV